MRAQLSGDELLLIMDNNIYQEPLLFQPLIEQCTILQYVPSGPLPDPIDMGFFEESAFESYILKGTHLP